MPGVIYRSLAGSNLSEILGHSNTQVTETHSHLSPEVMDRAMEETFGDE